MTRISAYRLVFASMFEQATTNLDQLKQHVVPPSAGKAIVQSSMYIFRPELACIIFVSPCSLPSI